MKPKLLLCLALVLSGGLFSFANIARCADGPFGLKVTLDIPEYYSWDGKTAFPRTLRNRDKDAHFFIVLEKGASSQILFISSREE